MKEPGRERGRVKPAAAVQVSKLQSSACNQRSGTGSLQECKRSPGIRPCRQRCWHRLPVTGEGLLSPGAGTPPAPLVPQQGVSCPLGCP